MTRWKNLEVRGCCFGIPIGCGSLMLLLMGGALWQGIASGGLLPTLLKLVAVALTTLVLGAGALLALGWWDGKRRSR